MSESETPATAPEAPDRGGRPRNDESHRAMARDIRWLVANALGDLPPAAIAGAERRPVSARTVRRGIASAKSRLRKRLSDPAGLVSGLVAYLGA
jgi:hypothetical protein